MGRSRSKEGGQPRPSQSVVVDPESDLQHTKEHLAAKKGIAPKEQRLQFSVPTERPETTSITAFPFSIGKGADWEGVLFQGKRCVGRLINPTVGTEYLQHRESFCRRQAEGQVTLQCITLCAAVCDWGSSISAAVPDMTAPQLMRESSQLALHCRADLVKPLVSADMHVMQQRHKAEKRPLGGSGTMGTAIKRTQAPYGSLHEAGTIAGTITAVTDCQEGDLAMSAKERQQFGIGHPLIKARRAIKGKRAHQQLDLAHNAKDGCEAAPEESSSDSACDIPTTPDVLSESPGTLDRARAQSESGSSSLDCQVMSTLEDLETIKAVHPWQRLPFRNSPAGVSRRKDKNQGVPNKFSGLRKNEFRDPVQILKISSPSLEDEVRSSDGSSSGPNSSFAPSGSAGKQFHSRAREGPMVTAGPSVVPTYPLRYQETQERWMPHLPPAPVFGPLPQGRWSPGFQMQYGWHGPQLYYPHAALVPRYYWDRPVFFIAPAPDHAVPVLPNHVLWAPPHVSETCLDRAEHAARTFTGRPANPGTRLDSRRPYLIHRKPPPLRRSSDQFPMVSGGHLQLPENSRAVRVASKVGSNVEVSRIPERILKAASGLPANDDTATSGLPSNDEMATADQVGKLSPKATSTSALSEAAVPVPLPRSVVDPECALDRFMLNVCPDIGQHMSIGAKGPVLNDVWNAFKDASFFGLEVYTEHGPRAPTSAIYIPVLSGCRLFVSKDQQGMKVPLSDKKVYSVDSPFGKDSVYAIFEHAEGGHARSRQPFFEAIQDVLKEDGSAACFQDLSLDALHPASWFAIRWHPLYRVPEAPLRAEFLTFHSFQPVPLVETYFGALEPSRARHPRCCKGHGPQILPIIAMRATIPKEEGWLDACLQSQSIIGSCTNEDQLLKLAQLRNLGLETHAATLAYSGGVHPVDSDNSTFQFVDLGAEKGVFEHIR